MITLQARCLPFELGLNPLTAPRKQWKPLRAWAGKSATSVVSSAGELARLLLSSILKQKRGS